MGEKKKYVGTSMTSDVRTVKYDVCGDEMRLALFLRESRGLESNFFQPQLQVYVERLDEEDGAKAIDSYSFHRRGYISHVREHRNSDGKL